MIASKNVQLPLLDAVPDLVYKLTEAPESEMQANQYLAVLRGELSKIETQLRFRFSEFSDRFGDDPVKFQEWRAELQRRKMVKVNQVMLLKAWKLEHQAAKQVLPQTALEKNKIEEQARTIESLQNRIANLKANIVTPEKEFSKCKRETAFLKVAIAQISRAVLETLQTGEIDNEAIANLKFLHDRLTDADNNVTQIQSTLKISA